ncbi:MAG: hypothetical protein V7749_13000 [Cocleimonas sp.]
MKKIIGLIIAALISGCSGAGLNSEDASSKSKTVDTSFYQHWVHSYEEQNGQKIPNIFRPKGSREFGPSRFRMEFAFDQNGQCNYKFLSSVDAHQIRNCVYTKIGNTVYLYDNGGASLSHLAFTIESVNNGEMRMAYGVATPVLKGAKKKS